MARRSDIDALEAYLEGRTAAEDTPRPIQRLGGLATAVRDHAELEAPTEEFRARLRAELLEVAAAGRVTPWQRVRDRVDDATARVRHSLRAAGAVAVASTMIGTAGVAAAAQSALPGDMLYSVKDFTEGVRLNFASGDLERGRLHLAYARERLDEVEAGRGRLSPDQLSATLDRLDHEAAAGADELLQAAIDDGPPVLDELDDFTAEVRLRLQDLTASLPLSVRPAAERTLEVLRRIDLQVTGLLGVDGAGCAVCADGTSIQPRVVLPGDGPAAPSCRCVQPAPGVDGTDADSPAEQPQDDPVDVSSSPDAVVVPDDSAVSGETAGDGLVGDVGSAVDDSVGDVGSVVDDVVDDVGSLVDDVLDPSATSSSNPLQDTVDDLGDAVEDTASDLGDTVGDVTGGVGDVTGGVGDVTGGVDDTVGDVTGGLLD